MTCTPGRARQAGSADRAYDAVSENDGAVVPAPPVTIEHGRVANDRRNARITHVGGRVRILVDPDRRFCSADRRHNPWKRSCAAANPTLKGGSDDEAAYADR